MNLFLDFESNFPNTVHEGPLLWPLVMSNLYTLSPSFSFQWCRWEKSTTMLKTTPKP